MALADRRRQMTNTDIKRERSFPACGRLIVLSASADFLNDANRPFNFTGWPAINFPSMPDAIDLVRRADYNVSNSPVFPDGVHTYLGSSVLEFPVAFKLHAFDKEYCPRGVESLLQVTALLQALVLPFGPSPKDQFLNYVKPVATDGTDVAKNTAYVNVGSTGGANLVSPPPTCYLELILLDRSYSRPGVAAIGYVKEVSAKLGGPYLRGPSKSSQLLPTTGEFSFIFVHHPGHQNEYNLQDHDHEAIERQAYADTVKDKLYNTADLISAGHFRSFADPATAAPDNPAVNSGSTGEAASARVLERLRSSDPLLQNTALGESVSEGSQMLTKPDSGEMIVNEFIKANPERRKLSEYKIGRYFR
jgi:hypothetical protein